MKMARLRFKDENYRRLKGTDKWNRAWLEHDSLERAIVQKLADVIEAVPKDD